MFEFVMWSSLVWGPFASFIGLKAAVFVRGSRRLGRLEERLVVSGLVAADVLAVAAVKAPVASVEAPREGEFVERVSDEVLVLDSYVREALVPAAVKRQALRVLDAVRQVAVVGRRFSVEEEHALESVVFSHLPESVRLFELLPERSLKQRFYQKSLVEQLTVLEGAVKSVGDRVVVDAENQLEVNRLFLESKFVGSRLSLGSGKTGRKVGV